MEPPAMLGEADTSADDQPGTGFDDLDGGSDAHTLPATTACSGPEPELGGFTTAAQHDEAVVARVRAWIDEGWTRSRSASPPERGSRSTG
ncbi:MAG: hypothetical protein R2754_01805 [Microthrixaceae bacterium]